MFKQVLQSLCFLSLLTPVTPANAEDRVPESLTLIGKGIANKAQGSMIAVACTQQVGPDCSEIRIVEFVNQTPHWLSKPYTVPDVSAFLKDVKSKYKSANRINMSVQVDTKTGSSFFYYGSMVLLAGSIACLSTLPGATVGTVLLVFAGPATTFGILSAITQGNVDVLGGALTVALSPVRGVGNAFHSSQISSLTAKDGWNWSVKPKYIGEKKYNKVKNILSETITDGKYARAETPEELEIRLEKIRVDLELREQNKVEHQQAVQNNQLKTVYSPQYNSSLKFSTQNPEPYLCRALGYTSGLMDSAKVRTSKRYEFMPKKLELLVNEKGEPLEAVQEQGAKESEIESVTCFGPRKDTDSQRSKIVGFSYPRFSNFKEYVTVANAILTPDAFCKYFGKTKAFPSGTVIENVLNTKYATVTSTLADGQFMVQGGPSGWLEVGKDYSASVYTSLVCISE